MSWKDKKRWSDQFLPQIKRIVGEYLIGESPIEEDQCRNTDLVVLQLNAVRIACRIRDSQKFEEKYGEQFTIRSKLKSGAETELAKIIRGYGDYFFYGFGDSDTGQLTRWTLARLEEFRLWFTQQIAARKGIAPGLEVDNFDGISKFRAFRWCDLPTEFIVASSCDELAIR